jgi:hypothetical protein
MIYVLEGPDGVGKTTLANAILAKTKGHLLHCTWRKEWTMWRYFLDIMDTAQVYSNRYQQDVVIDRWAPSEKVYGDVFRGGPSFDINILLKTGIRNDKGIKWVMCRNDNVVENHQRLLLERDEMFDDMSKVQEGFDEFVKESGLPWIIYDYDKVNMDKFVEELIGENHTN